MLGHPDDLLNSETDRYQAHGHIQNVRRGVEPLESGDFPLLADVIVKSREGVEAILSGESELSCGYSYRLAREGRRWEQRAIRGNHVALVPSGRAGAEASIDLRRRG